jgi:hypothetical protein
VDVTEDDFAKQAARILQEEIDKEVITEIRIALLVDEGWTRVDLPMVDFTDIGPWMQVNIQRDWQGFFNTWLFESADDATLFKIAWG